MVPSPAVEDKKVLGEIAKGPVEPVLGWCLELEAAPTSLPWDPCHAPLAAWAEGLASQPQEGGGSWLAGVGTWEPEPWD